MLKEFQAHLKNQFPFLEGNQLLVACSGGLDSVVLTHLLVNSGCEITLAHCNFSLRGYESDSDSEFVIQLAKKLEIPVYTEVFETETYADDHGLSIQMAARALRYQWFEELSNQLNIKYILTAHHLDDNLETFLINLSRGTGLRGLTGIPVNQDKLVRPLLAFSKETVLAYAEKNKLDWREDSSNASNKYLRNALRNEVVPKWKETVPSLLQNFQTTQKNLIDSRNLIEDYLGLLLNYLAEETDNGYKFSVKKLKALPNSKAVLFELFSPLGFTEFDDLYSLLSVQAGKKAYSPSHMLLKDRDFLFLEPINIETKTEEFTIPENTTEIGQPIHLSFKKVSELGVSSEKVIFVDFDLLKFPLILRKWKEGDTFFPFGMDGKKKISKYFKDEKLSLLAKQKTWLLCSENKIVWVVGLRADNRFRVTNKTKRILKIES
jgi:tRNA(Ile)-lysidine synthase